MSFWDKYPQLWSEWDKKQEDWNAWEIRIFILWSLLLQILLIQFASLRKRKADKWVSLFIWSTYLLADWVADFALGLLCNSQGGEECDSNQPATKIKASASAKKVSNVSANNGLVAFWAPFLLLHLGGPDTITAFALEDNELWLRHLLGLGFEFLAAAYVFLRSIPHNEFLIPTLLMFVAGLIKYGERTCALYFASMNGFRNSLLKKPDPGPNYAKLMEEYASKKEAGIPAEIQVTKEPESNPGTSGQVEEGEKELNDVQAVQSAHRFFKTFRGLIVDLIFSFHERNESMGFYLNQTAKNAFRVIEIELGFVYEVLYTKAVVIHSKCGYILRAICSSAILLAFLFFYFLDKRHFDKLDKAITYALIIGAMALDAKALWMLIFSDWTIVQLQKCPRIGGFVSKIADPTNNSKSKCPPIIYKALSWMIPFRFHHPRWSALIAQCNLIHFCLHDRETFCQKTMDLLHIKDLCDEWRYTSHIEVPEELKEFMFTELKKKAEMAKDWKTTKQLCSQRGDWAVEQRGYVSHQHITRSVGVEFDESLLLWHIATVLLYYTNEPSDQNSERPIPISTSNHRRLSNVISNYMLYLLVWQPNMMSATAGIGQIRYRDTCAEAKNFFLRLSNEAVTQPVSCWQSFVNQKKTDLKAEQALAAEGLLSVSTDVEPIAVKGDRSKSVLFDACILAKELKTLQEWRRWELISAVWAEMLAYSASRCRGHYHAQRLSKGGELITFVWFLMAHLGLGEQYRIDAGQATTTLILEE